MSILTKTFNEFGNVLRDAAGHVLHGDDAGTSETKVLYLKPEKHSKDKYKKFRIGMTFVSVNDRAFVRSVEPDSEADIAGIRAQDCLQFVLVISGDDRNNRMDKRHAKHFAMECEEKGKRTSFTELKAMFENSCVPVKGMNSGEMFDSLGEETYFNDENNVPITRRIRLTTQKMVGQCSAHDVSNLPLDDSPATPTGRALYPVVLVFRQTYKRRAEGSTPHVGMPYFRLDDECERAADIIRRLAPTAGSKNDPDAWDEIMDNASKYLGKKQKSKTPNSERDVELSTIRDMIQDALGLAFIRTSKVVLGLSFHFGSGIVISRLDDGTWSAPSAIGMYGAGLGVQFGLEVADYIFILQTEDALDHFRRGSNYTIGGNMGAAVGGVGREAYGAASVGRNREVDAHEKTNVAPIVAYAKSQGLYFGVSLEGSKIFARDDINRRAYKLTTGKECSTDDILSGRVPPPREAEDLYATLHSVEFAHDMLNLPEPPRVLVDKLSKDWYYGKYQMSPRDSSKKFNLFASLSKESLKEIHKFEVKFKDFLYGGISVQRITPNEDGGCDFDNLERRTIWLMLPEMSALRIGFISKRSDTSDDYSTQSDADTDYEDDDDDNTADESTIESRSTAYTSRSRRVQLSKKYSIPLSEVRSLRRISTNRKYSKSSDVKDTRVIEIKGTKSRYLLFIANTIREAELFEYGLKLLLERETTRVNIRGGIPIQTLNERLASTRSGGVTETSNSEKETFPTVVAEESKSQSVPVDLNWSSSENDENDGRATDVPEGRKSWSQVPTRNHLRTEAAGQHDFLSIREQSIVTPPYIPPAPANIAEIGKPSIQKKEENKSPSYTHGELKITDISTDVLIPIPLPLCRALILDSSSPLMKRWEIDRGDTNYSKTKWNFPPSSPRRSESQLPENQLLSRGSMEGGHRTILYDRLRNGQKIRLSETLVVVDDKADTATLTIAERMPRRGFSTKVRITLDKVSKHSCNVSIFGEIVPIGKNLSNQGAVHRAYLLVVDELRGRYSKENEGLLAGLISIVRTFPASNPEHITKSSPRETNRQGSEGIKNVSVEDENNTEISDSFLTVSDRNAFRDKNQGEVPQTPQRQKEETPERPSTPSIFKNMDNQQMDGDWASTTFEEWDNMFPDSQIDEESVSANEPSACVTRTIDVKPLPKLRLDLMPAPREEDEEDLSTV